MAIKIGDTTYAYLRDAINSAVSGSTILVEAGTYDIATTQNYTPGVPNSSITAFNKFYGPTAYSLSRFYSSQAGISGLTISGAGRSQSSIVNLTRIYTSSKDRGFGLPLNWTISDLTLNFNLPYAGSGTGDYILQAGNFPKPGDPYGLDGALTGLTLRNLNFTGNHAGSAGSNGAYSVLVRSDNLCVDGIAVTITGQQGYIAGSKTTVSSGGSSFLFLQGDGIKILNSSFYEAGFGNGLTIFDSTNFNVSNNSFDGADQGKQRGEVIKLSTGTLSGNTFSGGSYLDFLDAGSKSVNIVNNNFNGITDSSIVNIGVRIAETPTISAARTFSFSGNTFRDVVPFVSLINQAATGNTGVTSQLIYGSNNVYNPATDTTELWNRFLVGGPLADSLTGYILGATSRSDYIIGGPGNDTLVGNGGNDAFVFTAAPGTVNNNVDLISDFNAIGKGIDKIWLDDAIFTPLAKGELGDNFGRYINYTPANRCLLYDSTGLGGTVENGTTVFKVATLGPGLPTLTSTDFVVF